MPLTQLDDRVALIVIDLQRGIVSLPTSDPADTVVSRAAELVSAFRAHDLPVVLVNVAGAAPGRTDAEHPGGELPADWADLVPELGADERDHRVTKLRWGAFHDTGLDAHLRDLGVSQVVIVGIATSMGVESTARSAHEHGYHVVIAIDAVTDLDPDAHQHSVTRVFPAIAETTSTAAVLEQLDARRRSEAA